MHAEDLMKQPAMTTRPDASWRGSDGSATLNRHGTAVLTPSLAAVIERRFTLFQRLGVLNRRGMQLVDPWPIGAALGMSGEETARVLATLAEVGWIERTQREAGERVALTVWGLARL
jgi:hypothetical protein